MWRQLFVIVLKLLVLMRLSKPRDGMEEMRNEGASGMEEMQRQAPSGTEDVTRQVPTGTEEVQRQVPSGMEEASPQDPTIERRWPPLGQTASPTDGAST